MYAAVETFVHTFFFVLTVVVPAATALEVSSERSQSPRHFSMRGPFSAILSMPFTVVYDRD